MTVANSTSRIVEETLPLIIIFSLLGLFSGGFLKEILGESGLAPGLLILVPGMLGLRGNISSALGARLSSGLHLGYISTDKFSSGLKKNIELSIFLSMLLALVLSFFAWLVCSYTSGTCMALINFVLISLMTGAMSGVIMSFSTSGIAILSYRKGLDPDDTTMPISSSMGDIVTIISLLVSVKIVLGLGL